MRKGRFTKTEIQRAISSNCLGLEDFFCLILEVFIKGGVSTKTNKKNRFKYFSYENISFVIGAGLSYSKTEKAIKKRIKIIKKQLNIDIRKMSYPNEKHLFLHLALSFITLLKGFSIEKLSIFIGNVKSLINENISDLIFLDKEYNYVKNFLKNELVSDETIKNYILIYYNSLSKCFENRAKEKKKEKKLNLDIIQHIENILNVICNKLDNISYDNLRLEVSLFDISSYYYNTPEPILIYAKSFQLTQKCFFLTSKLQIININMPKHNGRTLLLKMLESFIDSLNLDLKYDFGSPIFEELNSSKQDKYYNIFFEILYKIGLIGKNNFFSLNESFQEYFGVYIDKYKDETEDQPFFRNISNQVLYVPVIIEIKKGNHTTLPIEICLQVIHYLYKISVLNCATYKRALDDIIVLYNREIYLNNDSRINSANYIKSQARKRDKILSDILHKYLGFLDIRIIAMLDEVNDFNEYDKEKLEKELRINEFTGINLFIIKFQDVAGYQVKFSLEDYVSLKEDLSNQLNTKNDFHFFGFKDVDYSINSSVISQQERILKDMGNTEYRTLHSIENYVYGKEILFTQETIPIITKYEINEFYEDLLNIKQVVADLYNVINTNQKTSFYGGYSIGVLGNFGAGKSSIINLLFSLLCNKNLDDTEEVYKEKTYKITLSDYSSESIVEEVYLQLEKAILKEQMELSGRKMKKKATIFFNHLKFWKWKKQKRILLNKLYSQKIIKENIIENLSISVLEKKRLHKKLVAFDPNSRIRFFKYFKNLESNVKNCCKTLKTNTKETLKNRYYEYKKELKLNQKEKIKQERNFLKKTILFFRFKRFCELRKAKTSIQNELYFSQIKANQLIERIYFLKRDQENLLKKIENYRLENKKSILKCFEKQESYIKKLCDDLISSLKEQAKKYLKQGKKQFFIEQKYYTKEVPFRKKEKKTVRLKKKIDSYIFSNHGISSTKEIEDNEELRRKKRYYVIWGIILAIISILSWIIVIVLYYNFDATDISGESRFKQNLFNFVPLLATIPSLVTSYYIYQGVRGRHTTVLSEHKIAVHHIEKLLVFSKELLYKRSKFYKNYKKYDERLSTYPLNTIIMIDNLDRISNERVGNVLQGISFINNEIDHSNITFIIPISYEKFYENTLFLNEQYTVKGKDVQFTYKNPDLDMPIVINNAYLNKVFDYKIFLPNLNEERFEKFICFALNKAIERRFLTLNSVLLECLIDFLKRYFNDRQTRNLRDIANVLNNLFSYIPTINSIGLTYQQKYFAILLMLVFCDIRYRFIEAIEELILSDKFIKHLKDRLLYTSKKTFYFYYSPFFKTKFHNTYEGRKYEMQFNSIVKLLKNEAEKKVVFEFEKEFIEKVWKIFKTNDSFPSDWRMDK